MGEGKAGHRLYFDEDADARLAASLKQRGYDVETTVDVGRLEASDEQQLRYAADQQRVLVTHNIRHFPTLHAQWMAVHRQHWGIVILIGQSTIGPWLRRLERLLKRFSLEELRNGLFFLGAEWDGSTR